ncbi:MAG: hypothetical protein GY865_16315 [candidate division Zixibacteria bacterium]|nr:hypothetical protein [candidate division Zixibacteria bacterium]
MNTQYFKTFILIILLISTVGCTKIVKRTPDYFQGSHQNIERQEKAPGGKHGNIIAVELSTDIISVVLSYNDIIIFDSLGGKFDYKSKVIYGNDTSGAFVEIKMHEMKQAIHNNWDSFIRFDKNGGKINTGTQLITGTTTEGNWVELPLDEVLLYEAKIVDFVATFTGCLLGASIVGLIIGFAIECKNKSPCIGVM